MTPDTNYGDSSYTPAPEVKEAHIENARAQEVEIERAKLQARIEALENDLKLITQGKEAAERCLRVERERALELAQNSNFSLKRDWLALVSEMKFLKGQEIGENPKDNEEYQEALVIDFCNRLRIGALAELESKDDDTLYVIAKSYEVWYRACTAVLANRSLKIKIDRTSAFEQTKKELRERDKEKKIAKEADKLDKRRRTPEEKMLESLMTLGMSEDQARAHMQQMQTAAQNMMQNKN